MLISAFIIFAAVVLIGAFAFSFRKRPPP
ncbi:hypothetical protein [Agrobacterium tumefaciens]